MATNSDKPPSPQFRVGMGYDVHRLVEGRPLILGGVTVPFERGLDGHSDADVLLHVIIDALLGAACLGDIGTYFPSSDPTLEGISSAEMVRQTHELVMQAGWRIENIDATVVAQRPRLSPYVPHMRASIADILGINQDRVSVKGKTTDGLGFAGTGDGMAAYCVAMLVR
ncbi:MAG TPA: 2-C-methyl-D-erythritol 2,4-cyclodiphosphate synthase [Chloroflexia bacterium]|nr:2-C-methyl-D-erythritol 2,4-cyclodiphosphate synthase [Chloroflexia bacterium]